MAVPERWNAALLPLTGEELFHGRSYGIRIGSQ